MMPMTPLARLPIEHSRPLEYAKRSALVLIWLGVLFSSAILYAQRDFNDPRVQAQLKTLEAEPSIQEVHKAALKFYHAEPSTISSMRLRAQLKSLLPDVHVRYRQSSNGVFIDKFDFLQGDPTLNNMVGQDESKGDVTEFQVSGSWSLSRLLFNPEVLDVASLAALQEGILKEVTRLYYTRRRLQIDLILSDPKDPGTRLSKELRIDQLTATLDALTNSLFRTHSTINQRVTRGGEW
jgi:hypothetical protein